MIDPECELRHPNGNCLAVGCFCSFVPGEFCCMVHVAYYHGLRDGMKIDAEPEIIHCGDCKYKDDGIDEDGIPFLKCLNGRSYGGTRINDFCSWAERKNDA